MDVMFIRAQWEEEMQKMWGHLRRRELQEGTQWDKNWHGFGVQRGGSLARRSA